MPVTTRRRTSQSAAGWTCRAWSDSELSGQGRDELRETLVGLTGAGLHARGDHGIALLFGVEDSSIPQLRHALALDERDLHEPVSLRHVAEEEAVDELLRGHDLAVRAVEVDDFAAGRVRDELPLAALAHVHLLDLGRVPGEAPPLRDEVRVRDDVPHDLTWCVELLGHQDLSIRRQGERGLVLRLSGHDLSPVLSLPSARRPAPPTDPSGRSSTAGTSPATCRAR